MTNKQRGKEERRKWMENGGNPRFPGARFVVGNGGEGRGVLAQEGGQREKGIARDREEGEDATPAREEPPRSRSWQVASSPVVVTALKPRSKASCRAIFGDRYGRLLSAGKTGLFIYLFIHLFIPSSLFGDFINRLSMRDK